MHYVCSDIHGYYERFRKLLKKIDFSLDDEMYVIGDVIDRGPEPIELLLYILSQPNIHLLIGNHEHMMMTCRHHADLTLWRQNGANVTIRQMNRLSETAQQYILSTMSKCPLAIPDLEVNGRHYYLVHAKPLPFYINKPLPYNLTPADELHDTVWDRDFVFGKQRPSEQFDKELCEKYRGYTTIVGHTPVIYVPYGIRNKVGQPRISRTWGGHLINVDCGCGQGKNLGCLRLEDHHEFYV